MAGQVVADRAILVVRDSGQSLPGLLGMNVLANIPRFAASISHLVVPDGTKFARVVARQAVCVPAQTKAYIRVVGGFQGQTALLEPMATGCGPLLVTSALVQGTVYFAAMVNPTEKDFWVQPGTRIGIVQPAKVLPKFTDIVVNANEIVVGTNSEAPTSSEPSQLPIDLTAFEGTDQELQDVKALFSRHHSVFAKSDNDLGCTMAVQHRIRTTDDVPVTMPIGASLRRNWRKSSRICRSSCSLVPSSQATVRMRVPLYWCERRRVHCGCVVTSGPSMPRP